MAFQRRGLKIEADCLDILLVAPGRTRGAMACRFIAQELTD